MKKALLLIMVVFLLALVGCNNNADHYLLDLEKPIEVCGDNCEMGIAAYKQYYPRYLSNVEILYNKLITGRYEYATVLGRTNMEVNREDLVPTNIFSENDDIPIALPYSMWEEINYELNEIITYCSLGGTCRQNTYGDFGDNITELEYGLSIDSGYYTYLEDELKKHTVSFNFFEDGFEYEIFNYNLEDNTYSYKILKDGIYRQYEVYEENVEYKFSYINLNTYECIEYTVSEDDTHLEQFNPEKEVKYTAGNSSYSVSLFKDFNIELSVLFFRDTYHVRTNILSLKNWDTFLNKPREYKLFNNGQEVYTDYEITIYRSTLYYTQIIIEEELLPDELDSYSLFDSLESSSLKADLEEGIEIAKDITLLFNEISISQDEIDAFINGFYEKNCT